MLSEITERGGKGIAAYVDHSNMDEVKQFFEKIERDHNGQLDILVNNAYSAVKVRSNSFPKYALLLFFFLSTRCFDSVDYLS